MILAEKLSRAISKLEINNVFLTGADIKLFRHPGVIKPEHTSIDVTEETKWSLSPSGDILICHVRRTLTGTLVEAAEENGTSVEGEEKKALLFDVLYAVQYVVTDPDRTIDEHTFEVFCKTNAVYNSYPYYREYVQSTCARMGIPPIVMSFLKPLTMKQIVEMFPDKATENPQS